MLINLSSHIEENGETPAYLGISEWDPQVTKSVFPTKALAQAQRRGGQPESTTAPGRPRHHGLINRTRCWWPTPSVSVAVYWKSASVHSFHSIQAFPLRVWAKVSSVFQSFFLNTIPYHLPVLSSMWFVLLTFRIPSAESSGSNHGALVANFERCVPLHGSGWVLHLVAPST